MYEYLEIAVAQRQGGDYEFTNKSDILFRDCCKTLLGHRVIEDSYIFNNPNAPNNLIFTIEPWAIDGIEGSRNWVMYLRRFYVVSSQRG